MTRPTAWHAPGMVDVHDAAQLLGCDAQTVRRLAHRGRLEVTGRAGRALLFARCDVEQLVGHVHAQPEDPDLCPLCRCALGDDAVVWDPETPGRPVPPPPARPEDDHLVELVAFPVRFCPDCDVEARIAQVLADRRTPTPKEA